MGIRVTYGASTARPPRPLVTTWPASIYRTAAKCRVVSGTDGIHPTNGPANRYFPGDVSLNPSIDRITLSEAKHTGDLNQSPVPDRTQPSVWKIDAANVCMQRLRRRFYSGGHHEIGLSRTD